ncbi:MAG: glycosyltransferase family 4 protein [bacterium]|nr:glycosyltransferase family 4 protein [bacterium]
MRIAAIAAGAAGMICGSCLRDNTLAAALIGQGHDVALLPTYTPLRTDEDDVSRDRIFYGAVNVYLEQKTSLFRHTPWLVDRLLNGRGLLEWVSKKSVSVDARDLGELTLSVLRGEDGHQKKELGKLLRWLKDEFKPDIVQLPNAMFLGLAGPIRRELGVPVLCELTGEDIFLDELTDTYREQVVDTLRERAADASGFVATSEYYAEEMSTFLRVSRERIHTVAMGLKLDGHGGDATRPDGPFTVGYLARLCPEKGLHALVEAFRRLRQGSEPGSVRLRVAGYLGERDRAYVDGIKDEVVASGLGDSVDWVGEVDRAQKIEFLRGLHALSVPTTYREPKGLYVLEALANATPVVQPRHGAFPELVGATGGGVLVEPDSPDALARGLRELMDDEARRAELGRRGREIVHARFTDQAMADETLRVFERYVGFKDA